MMMIRMMMRMVMMMRRRRRKKRGVIRRIHIRIILTLTTTILTPGILNPNGTIDNEASIHRLAEVALVYAQAGSC